MNPLLEIFGVEMITSIADSFKTNSNIAGHIKSITIDDKKDDADEDEEEPAKEQVEEGVTRSCDSLGFILEEICLHGQLESFSWTGYDMHSSAVRSEVFWEALSKAAATLRDLNLGFYVHEIHKLGKLVSSGEVN